MSDNAMFGGLRAPTEDEKKEIQKILLNHKDSLENKVKALERKLEIAVEALTFYGDQKNWESKDINRNTKNKVYDICLFDFTRNLKSKKDYAGSRARFALEQIKGK